MLARLSIRRFGVSLKKVCSVTVNNSNTDAFSGNRHKYKGPSALPSVSMQGHHHNTDLFSNGDFVSRDSDIWIVSGSKAGTTWAQHVVYELLYDSDKALRSAPMAGMSPWAAFHYRMFSTHCSRRLEAQSHRRFMKSHEPIEALPFNAKNKHIVLVRDFRDVIWSLHNHAINFKWWVRFALNSPTCYRKTMFPKLANGYSAKDFWDEMTTVGDQFGNPDGAWLWSPLWVLGSWMHASRTNAVDRDSILFVHYMDLCRDPLSQIKRMADFINVEASGQRLLEVREKTSMEAMRKHKDLLIDIVAFKEGNATFFKKGGSRRDDWRSELDATDLERCRDLTEYYNMDAGDIDFMENGSDVFNIVKSKSSIFIYIHAKKSNI